LVLADRLLLDGPRGALGQLRPVAALISSVLFGMAPKLIAGGLLVITGVVFTRLRSRARPI
jgi:hypothetical protein